MQELDKLRLERDAVRGELVATMERSSLHEETNKASERSHAQALSDLTNKLTEQREALASEQARYGDLKVSLDETVAEQARLQEALASERNQVKALQADLEAAKARCDLATSSNWKEQVSLASPAT